MFERSKWLREGMIYLELLLCFALESWLLMCEVEMASSRDGDMGASVVTHTASLSSAGHMLLSLSASFDSARHLVSYV